MSLPQIRLFDSHCHLDDKSFDRDIGAVLSRAGRAGVKAYMVASRVYLPRSASIPMTPSNAMKQPCND